MMELTQLFVEHGYPLSLYSVYKGHLHCKNNLNTSFDTKL